MKLNPINLLKRILTRTAAALLCASVAANADLVSVTNDIAAGTEVTWYATNEYRLDTVIYVQSNAVLHIEPGTVIYGATNVTIGRTDIPSLVSALWVTRGGKLYATGTVDQPIIFTAEGDDLSGNLGPRDTGLWGGVVMLGNAPINSASDTDGNAADPKYEVYEGTDGPGENGEHVFGGSDPEDSSGALRYVSIRHPGNEFAPAAELNGLTMGGVGRGTILEHVEVFASSDDGFEWWGGTVNSKYLVAGFIEDDDFDTDQGYSGTNQFWFGIKPPWAGTADSRGMETDGDLYQTATGEEPISQWVVWNATLIGRGLTNADFGGGVGWNARDETAANVRNSVLTEFNQGLKLDADGLLHFTNSPALAGAQNNVWNVTSQATADGEFLFTDLSFTNELVDPLLGGVSYTNDAGLNPRPGAGSAVYSNVLEGAPMPVGYRGAFAGEGDTWADGWTALSSLGYLSQPAPVSNLVVVTNDIAAGTEVTWYATNEYRLDTVIYVQSNAVLHIEPGTVIYGATNVTIGRTDIPSLVSALWVTRGGKLYATGTVDQPIIFTAEGDDLSGNLGPRDTGLWGGVVMLGNAPINSASDTDGNAADPKYEVYEGTDGPGENGEHVFGGSDPEDSSGALRYVSIRHPGNEFAPAAELNGLTMGGVGRGTILEHVEVFASSDDGFEWWGGTVNSKYLVAGFIEDDDFDTDQGYSGTNQFWFGIKPPWAGTADSRGMETDGDLYQTATGEEPISQWVVWNATLIGRGLTNADFGGGVGWNARDETAANVRNSVLTEFNQGLKLDADGLLHFTNSPALAGAQNNVWNVTSQATADGEFLFTDLSFTNELVDPLLGGVSYTNDAGLNPRPGAGSAVYSNVLEGAPMPVGYRGAFAGEGDTWADGWTALSSLGYLSQPAPVSNLVVVTNDIAAGTEVTWYATNEYRLDTVIYVQSNAVLHIEPGTVIYGATNVTIGRTDIPSLVSALWVTRGGKLYATGTVDQPIIFTAEGDDLSGNLGPRDTGLWGGVVMLGNAPINSASDTDGNAADPKYEVYEGTDGPGENGEHVFGGSDPEDSSGALRYVSIRHPGNEFAPAAELNGLTMGGVGRGTILEHVEVFASSDDGFEWWGGTVNSKYLVAGFIEDDDFDTDQGYSGTNQFWFGIKPPWAGTADSRGMETDGDLYQTATGEEPISQWVVWNATLIGRGLTNADFGGGVGWNARDETAANVRNSVLTEFNQGLKLDADGLLHFTNSPALAGAQNNVWNVTSQATADGEFLFTDLSFTNELVDPLLGGVSYTNDAGLNPRPGAGSAVYSNVLEGAPMPVGYRGAFAGEGDTWADGWTALSSLGYLSTAPTVIPPSITAQPQSQTVQVGGEATFTVTAAGSDPLSYQWSKDGTPLAGANVATLVLTNVQLADGGSYTVTVTNTAGIATSDPAVLTVEQPAEAPEITQQPEAEVNAVLGESISLTVVATGTEPLAYQWTLGGTPLDSATNATLTFNSIAATNAGTYAVTVSNSAGSVTSSNSVVTVAGPTVEAGISGGQVQISIPTQPGLTYQVQSATSLTSPVWVNEGEPVAGDGQLFVFDQVVVAGENRFFRVLIQ